MASNVVEITEAFSSNRPLKRLRVKMHVTGGDLSRFRALTADPLVAGFSVNLRSVRDAGETDYPEFSRKLLALAGESPVCLPVCTDDADEIARQAKIIGSWASNAYVSIPALLPNGEGTFGLLHQLSGRGVKVNVVGIVKAEQARHAAACLAPTTPAFFSFETASIADSGADPLHTIRAATDAVRGLPRAELIWSGGREISHIFQAEAAGVQAVEVPAEIVLRARRTVGSDLTCVAMEVSRRIASEIRQAAFSLPDELVH